MREILRHKLNLSEVGPAFENLESQAIGEYQIFGGRWPGESWNVGVDVKIGGLSV